MELTFNKTDQFIRDNGMKIIFKVLVSINGPTGEATLASGQVMKCTEKESKLGQTADPITAISLGTKGRVSAYMNGLIIRYTRAIGKMGNSTETELT